MRSRAVPVGHTTAIPLPVCVPAKPRNCSMPGSRRWDPQLKWDAEVEKFLEECMGRERFASIASAITRPPLETCIRLNRLRSTATDVICRLPTAVREDGDITVETMDRKYAPYVHPLLPMAIMIPGAGPKSVDYGEDCCLTGKEVIVGRMAGESILRGADVYAPGILAYTRGIEQGDVVAVSTGVEKNGGVYGVTRGTILKEHIPLDDERFPDRDRLFLGKGIAMMSRSDINPSGKGLVVKMTHRVYSLPSLGKDVLDGSFMLQNLPSLAAAAAVDPSPGSKVLDMCAAPGGKTMAMAEMMGNSGEVYAIDRSHVKVAGITKLAEELGISIVKAFKADATKILSSGGNLEISDGVQEMSVKETKRMERIAAAKAKRGEDNYKQIRASVIKSGFREESFDHVLLDAPCSALGLRPRLMVSHSIEDLKATAHYQRKLIDVAVALVRKGGTLVYSTCTINPLENEYNVRYVLDKYPQMSLVKSKYHLGQSGLCGKYSIGEKTYQFLNSEEAELVQRYDPGLNSGTDTMGFFIAKFQKNL